MRRSRKKSTNLNESVIKLKDGKNPTPGSADEAEVIVQTAEKLGMQLTKNRKDVLDIVKDHLLRVNI